MIFNLLKNAAMTYGSKTAIQCDDQIVGYNELLSSTVHIGNKLKSDLLGNHENVAIFMDNSIEFVKTFFAINYCGGVILPIYSNCSFNKLVDMVKTYDIKYIITLKKHLDVFNFSYFENNEDSILSKVFILDNDSIQIVYSKDSPYMNSVEDIDVSNDLELILFSSGTTSISKGIMLSSKNICSNIKGIVDYLQPNQKDNILLIKNINHASSIIGEMLVSVYCGCTLFMSTKVISLGLILNLIDRNEITIFFAVPSILISLINYKHIDDFKLKSLKKINFYGAIMDAFYIQKLADKLQWVELIYSYGLTEASPRVSYIKRKDLLKTRKSCGKPITDVEVFILNESKNPVDTYEIGEIVVKGPNVMLGYYKNPTLTNEVIQNDMLFTKDLGYKDENGFLYVTGRKDNMIIQSGKNIYPEEIENILCKYKGIKEVLVRGEADDYLGEMIVAYVVLEEGVEVKQKSLLEFCRLYLEDYKVPRKIMFITNLEKTPSGKIIRKQVI